MRERCHCPVCYSLVETRFFKITAQYEPKFEVCKQKFSGDRNIETEWDDLPDKELLEIVESVENALEALEAEVEKRGLVD